MKTPSTFVASSLLALLLIAQPFSGRSDTIVIEKFTTSWGGGEIVLRFEGEVYEIRYPAKTTAAMEALGYSLVPKLDATRHPVPNYVLNLRDAANATRRYWAGEILPFGSGIPPVFRVGTPEVAGAEGTFVNSRLEFFNRIVSPKLTVSPLLSPTDSIHATIHEWSHAGQASNMGAGPSGTYEDSYFEGSAEWATDLPITVRPRGVARAAVEDSAGIRLKLTADPPPKPPVLPDLPAEIAADEFNVAHSRYASFLGDGEMVNAALAGGGYGAYPLWKFFAQRAGGSENSLAKVVSFGQNMGRRSAFEHREFVEELARLLPQEGGGGLDNFRYFFEDFISASTRLSASGRGDDRFEDEGFRTMRVDAKVSPNLDLTGFYSDRPPQVAESEASDVFEIRERLASVAISTAPIGALGWRKARIEPADEFSGLFGSGGPAVRADYRPTRLFLLVLGTSSQGNARSELALAALAASGEKGRITPATRMDRLDLSLQSGTTVVKDRHAAYTSLGNFNGEGDIERLYLALGNTDPDRRPHQAMIAYTISPWFYEFAPTTPKPDSRDRHGIAKAHLVASVPERDIGKDSFQGGDEMTFQLCVSDLVHVGGPASIAPGDMSLKVVLSDPDGGEIEAEEVRASHAVESVEGLAGDKPVYRVSLRLPEELPREGTYRARFEVSSLLRLGPDDRDTAEIEFFAGEPRPLVTSVRVEGADGEVRYDSAEGIFRPVPPGTHELKVTFDKEIDPASTASSVELGGERLPGRIVDGGRAWLGTLEIPAAPDLFASWEGVRTLSIAAVSAMGVALDSDPEAEGDQPDEQHRLVVDTPRLWLERLAATVDGEAVYEAEWSPTPDEENRLDWREGPAAPGRRTLQHAVRRPFPPGTGEAEAVFTLSAPAPSAPRVRVDGKEAAVEPAPEDGAEPGRTWRFRIDVEELLAGGDPNRPIPLEVEAFDDYQDGLDADPSTPPTLRLPEAVRPIGAPPFRHWIDYDDRFAGGDGAGKGGPDLWHVLNLAEDTRWIEETDEGEVNEFTLHVRGGQMIAQFEGIDYRGRLDVDGVWELRARPTLDYSLSKAWYHHATRRRIPTPVNPIQQAYATGSRDLYYAKSLKETAEPEAEWRFSGTLSTFTLFWNDEDELIRIRAPLPWTGIRWKPRAGEEAPEEPGPEEETEEDDEDESVVDETLYRVTERNVGGVLVVAVERVSYRQEGGRARLAVSASPVSYMEDRESGHLLYRVQWGSAREVLTRVASGRDQVASLRGEFEERSAGGFPRAELDERLRRVFGEAAAPLANR